MPSQTEAPEVQTLVRTDSLARAPSSRRVFRLGQQPGDAYALHTAALRPRDEPQHRDPAGTLRLSRYFAWIVREFLFARFEQKLSPALFAKEDTFVPARQILESKAILATGRMGRVEHDLRGVHLA